MPPNLAICWYFEQTKRNVILASKWHEQWVDQWPAVYIQSFYSTLGWVEAAMPDITPLRKHSLHPGPTQAVTRARYRRDHTPAANGR